MNVLFLTIAFTADSSQRNIYFDLMQEFKSRGNQVYVVTAQERRNNKQTELLTENGIDVLRVKTGNLQKTNIIEKGISTLMIEFQYIKNIKRYYKNIKFDLIIYSTPPITFERVIRYIRKSNNAKSYLLLKDIFPQNAVDLNLINENGFIYKYFRNKEKKLYSISDYIGCMSEANVNYVINHNNWIDKGKVEICPNTIKPCKINYEENSREKIRKEYGIPQKSIVYIYGGNLGRPQGIDFLIEILKAYKNDENNYFVIAGSGTEYSKVDKTIKEMKISNVCLLTHLQKNKYDLLVRACDIGMIFLDKRFTIPNFPSRILTYMEFSMPIIAATDNSTDIGKAITKGKFGLWSESGNIEVFKANVSKLSTNSSLRSEMGKSAREYLITNYHVSKSYDIIMKHFKMEE